MSRNPPAAAARVVFQKLAAGVGVLAISAAAIFGGRGSGPPPEPRSSKNAVTFRTAADIPPSWIRDKRTLEGIVIKVIDGDTLRIRHMPHPSSSSEFDGTLSAETISVRIAAVDSPEIAKYGEAGQAFGLEAKAFTVRELGGKKVRVKVLGRDRYSRLLGVVRYTDGPTRAERDISVELLSRGMAVLYRQGGAQYDGRKDVFIEIEAEARRKKVGLWGDPKFESPADYKKSKKSKTKERARVRQAS